MLGILARNSERDHFFLSEVTPKNIEVSRLRHQSDLLAPTVVLVDALAPAGVDYVAGQTRWCFSAHKA